MLSLRVLLQRPQKLTLKESQYLVIQGKELQVVRLPCMITYLLCQTIPQTAARASHPQPSIADLLG